MKQKILVIGSSNTDMVVQSQQLPVPGETVLGHQFLMNAGGKGANQAVAAAKLDGRVAFICKVGNDIFGTNAIADFEKQGIDTSSIIQDPAHPSGVALIMVNEQGENCISVALGANEQLTKADILAHHHQVEQCDLLLVQLEIPIPTVLFIVELASELGKQVILNPAPANKLTDSVFKHLSILTPNETEAKLLTGITVEDENSAKRAALKLRNLGTKTVIITLGAKGVYLSDKAFEGIIPAPKVKAIDSTAAGDTFNGALAVALAAGKDMVAAVKFANRAAAFSVTKLGAQSSCPTLKDLELMPK
ncbi:MAG: ribokinase [Bacteroidota bacterium]